MKTLLKSLVLLTLLIAFLSGAVPAAPVPLHLMPLPPFFPTQIGTKWVYKVSGECEAEITQTITSVKDEDGVKTVKLRVTYEEVTPKGETHIWVERVELHADGLYFVAPWPDVVGSNICLVKIPYRAGDKWEEDHPKLSLKRTCETFEAERVKVPAGEFQAVRVETFYAVKGEKATHSCDDWYARGVGLVKSQRRDIDRVQVLKSFTLGKD